MRKIPPLFKHQKETADFIVPKPSTFVTSTPGTGKTRSLLEVHSQTPHKTLVISPKTIMEPAWGQDLDLFYPNIEYGIFDRKHQNKPFYFQDLFENHEIVIINHDAVHDVLTKAKPYLKDYDRLVYDEFTAVKNRTAARSKATEKLAHEFEYKTLLSGSPTPRDLCDIWHPAFILDGGQRLGSNFFAFRNAICQPVAKGYHQQFVEWEILPGAVEEVAHTLRDITIRHELEDVVEMPDRIYRPMVIKMPAKLRKAYNEMKTMAILELESGNISAVNKAVLQTKLLQICGGSIYDNNGDAKLLHTDKYNLITQLVKEREASLVFFIWRHQRDIMVKLFKKAGIEAAVIDGHTTQTQRGQIVKDFQNGKYDVVLLQPAAAAHGLTLTRSTTTIWASPTYNYEHFIQANHRDYRIGQKKKSEVIMVQYENTLEQSVYNDNLASKKQNQDRLLKVLKT